MMEQQKDCYSPVQNTPCSHIWAVEYDITGIGKGCAVCKAPNPQQVEMLLKSKGRYNSTPSLYKILSIRQVIIPPCEDLIADVSLTYRGIKND